MSDCYVIVLARKFYLRFNPVPEPAGWTPEKPIGGYRHFIWTRKLIDADKFLTAPSAQAFALRYLSHDQYEIAEIGAHQYGDNPA